MRRWGGRVVVPGGASIDIDDTLDLELRTPDRTVARCRARVLGRADYDVGSELSLWIVEGQPQWTAVAELAPPDLDTAPTTEPAPTRLPRERIAARLRALAATRARAEIRSAHDPESPVVPARLDPERGLLMEWHPDLASLEPPFAVRVEGPFSTLSFVHDTLHWPRLPTPSHATVIHRRQMRRVPVPSGAKVLLRGLPGHDMDLCMHDVSFGGVSATLDATVGCEALARGATVPEVIVTWRGGPGLRFSGHIRHRSAGPRAGDHMIGLRLCDAPEDQRERWAREVETLLYPNTRSYGHDYASIWNLFEESGYFDISQCVQQTADFLQLRSAFETSYGKIDGAPELGCLATWQSPTRVEASITGLRVWSRSWFGMQLARNPVRPHIVRSDSAPLRDIIFHVFERAGANPDLDWIVHYVRDDSPGFSRVLFRDLVLSVPGSCGVPFEAWKFDVTMLGDWTMPNVSTATPAERDAVLATLPALRPRPYLEALDLLPERFDQAELREQWEAHGLQRERALLVAREDGEVVAAALVEACEDGLHLYGLLDGVRLFELRPGGRDRFPALLVAANEWFYAMGKSAFVCFDEDAQGDLMQSCGGSSLGRAVTTYLPRTATPQLLERVAELTTPK